jgi:hypothetical protein
MTHQPYTGTIEVGKLYENFLGMRRRVTRMAQTAPPEDERGSMLSFVRIAPNGKEVGGNTVFIANFRRWVEREVTP